jgi:hypothetical protein
MTLKSFITGRSLSIQRLLLTDTLRMSEEMWIGIERLEAVIKKVEEAKSGKN